MNHRATPHPWITDLQAGLDQLEKALLAGDAAAVEQASAQVQGVLQKAPKTAEFAAPGTLRSDMLQAAHRSVQHVGPQRARRCGPTCCRRRTVLGSCGKPCCAPRHSSNAPSTA